MGRHKDGQTISPLVPMFMTVDLLESCDLIEALAAPPVNGDWMAGTRLQLDVSGADVVFKVLRRGGGKVRRREAPCCQVTPL